MKNILSLLAVAALTVMTAPQAADAALADSCSVATDLPCRGAGNDKKQAVEDALYDVVGMDYDLDYVSTGNANDIMIDGFQFTFTVDRKGKINGGNWVDTLGRGMVDFLTVKSGREFLLQEVANPNGGSFTFFESINGGGKSYFPSISHVRLWWDEAVDVPLGGMLGLTLVGLAGLAARRKY
ncbi:hypothetical protein [Aestuariispira insulae]|nr:hypothetical protein [Aestuariispira insulae]